MPPRSISDEFNDSYAEQGLQPSTGRREVIKYARVERAKGVTRASGKTMQRKGKAMTKAGMALSRTGVGAVVGVPLMVVGGATQAKGAMTQVTGTTTRQSGREMQSKQAGLRGAWANTMTTPAEKIKDVVKGTRTFVWILSWALPLWFGLQLPIAILTIVTYGAADTAASFLPNWLVEWAANDLLILLQYSVFFIGIGTLIAMGVIYSISGVKCFFGEGAHIKGPLFCLAVVGYILPFVNIFPWFLLWAIAVWRYPK